MNTPILVGLSGPLQSQRFEINTAGLRIGRDPRNEVHLDDPDVSRQHARVILYNGGLWVQDAGSRNGVYVNDKKIETHKQISPGDRLSVGGHAFQIDVLSAAGAAEEQSVAVDMASVVGNSGGDSGQKKWKIWPFALAIGLTVGLLGLMAVAGGGDGGVSTSSEPMPTAPAGGAYSLGSALEAASSESEEADAATKPVDLASTLSEISDSPLDGMESWPDPPEGSSTGELVDLGHSHYNAGRLHEALTHYQMALKLDPNCEICTVRLERVSSEIETKVRENFDAGVRYYENLQYRQAINAWETVLMLQPDPENGMHMQTKDYLEQANAQVQRQY